MKQYRLKIGGDPIDFVAENPEGFLEAWRSVNLRASSDDKEWLKQAAMSACDWAGGPIRYDNATVFAQDMMSKGMLEEINAES